jgi:galactokinase
MSSYLPEGAKRISDAYYQKYGNEQKARIFRSPGRINLIGEHTDYNDGFVMPAAIDKAIYFALTPRADDKIFLHSVDFDQTYETTLVSLVKPALSWPQYQLGVIDQLQKKHLQISGFQASFGGDIPSGAGLSSSAALQCCLMFALSELNNLKLDKQSIALLSQKAENEYVGLNCGIMDQFASVFGKQESVIRLDCRSLEYEYFPFPTDEHLLILCDTTVKHSLADSEYNNRREECEKGVAILKQFDPGISSLRDVRPALVEQHKDLLGEVVYRRCKYVTSEIERVRQASDFLIQNNLPAFGEKMFETHHGLQYDYEVSCPELDFLVDTARKVNGVLGARMMGGGFGGCTINLVKREAAEQFETLIKQSYINQFGIVLPCFQVNIQEGTSELIF